MKLYLSTLTLALILIPSVTLAGGFRSAKAVDDLLIDGKRFDVTGRYVRGDLDERIIDIHRVTITENGVAIRARVIVNEEANHRALRRHADCVLNPSTCKSQAVR